MKTTTYKINPKIVPILKQLIENKNKRMRVFVVTNVELGWDCVCGVYRKKRDALESCFSEDRDLSDKTDKELELMVSESMSVVHEKELE